MKLDFGSGHRPRAGYLTCDCTGSPFLDYYFDPIDYRVLGCDDNTFDVIQVRNVIHHIKDLKKLFNELHRILKIGGRLVIIDSRPEAFAATVFLDTLWYRAVIPRHEVWFSTEYRDYRKLLTEYQMPYNIWNKLDKEITIAKKYE